MSIVQAVQQVPQHFVDTRGFSERRLTQKFQKMRNLQELKRLINDEQGALPRGDIGMQQHLPQRWLEMFAARANDFPNGSRQAIKPREQFQMPVQHRPPDEGPRRRTLHDFARDIQRHHQRFNRAHGSRGSKNRHGRVHGTEHSG